MNIVLPLPRYNHPNIRRYGMLVVGWLCLHHGLGWTGRANSSIQSIHISFTLNWFIDQSYTLNTMPMATQTRPRL